MTVLKEGDLELNIPAPIHARKFDGADHGLSHCMKAVDFIVELKDRYVFIEIKDPQHRKSKPADRKMFVKSFLSGKLDEDLKYKYRDSFLYAWASGKVDKPIYYWVLVAIDTLTAAELITRTDALKRILPSKGPASGAWKHRIVAGCTVFNISAWNQHLPDYPATRIGGQKRGI